MKIKKDTNVKTGSKPDMGKWKNTTTRPGPQPQGSIKEDKISPRINK